MINMGRRGRDRMVVGFTTTYGICAYHHWCCEFESCSGRDVQHYGIKFVSDLRQVGGFLYVIKFVSDLRQVGGFLYVIKFVSDLRQVGGFLICDKVCQ